MSPPLRRTPLRPRAAAPPSPASPIDQLVAQSASAARVLTLRGLLIRILSAGAGLVLLALVTPTQLGFLAIVRGSAATLEQCLELGLAWPLLRQRQEPTREEFGALAGVQLLLLTLAVAAFAPFAALWPHTPTALAALDRAWRPWVAATLASMLVIPLGTGARLRLERQLRFGRLALIEVSATLLHTAVVLGFAIVGRFPLGVFAAQILLVLYMNVSLYLAAPGPFPSLRTGPLLHRLRSSAGFSAAYLAYAAREQATPLVVAALFGLRTAGIWAFSMRLGLLVQFAYEGFARVAVPAAARLAGDREALRRLVAEGLEGAAALAVPVAVVLAAWLPVIALGWPQWTSAIPLAQVYVPSVTIAGVAAAALAPAALALRGWPAIAAEHLVPLSVSWAGLLLLRSLVSDDLALVVAATQLSAITVLVAVTGSDVLPRWTRSLTRVASSAVTGATVYFVAGWLGFSPVATAVLTSGGVLLWLRPDCKRWARCRPAGNAAGSGAAGRHSP